MSIALKEYIVTVKTFNDLDSFYIDMNTKNSTVPCVPSRHVECVLKKPVSRNTHYKLTTAEAQLLKNDPRVEAVNIKVKKLSEQTKLHSQITADWNKGPTPTETERNYGLYRCTLAENVSLWGSDIIPTQNSTVRLNSSGKNVDIIIVDTILYPDHPEFGGRVIQYDWFGNHDVAVKGSSSLAITNVSRTSNIATVTTQAPHFLNADAVVNVTITVGDNSFDVTGSVVIASTETTFQYTSVGPDVGSTSVTGSWIGVYQYNSYTSINNHATHVAAIAAGDTNGWASEANIYNLRSDTAGGIFAGDYTPHELLIDYIKEFHANKPINPTTGRKNPTLVNNSWGFGFDVNDLNPNTSNSIFSEINWRGSPVTPSLPAVDTGVSGIFSSSTALDTLASVVPGSGNRIVTDLVTPDTVTSSTSISFVDTNRTGLVSLGAPTLSNTEGVVDANDDAYWQLSLPFQVNFLSQNYQNDIFVGSNSYITFGSGSTTTLVGAAAPLIRKIMMSGGDRNCDDLLAGTFGTAPNRTYTVRYEGFNGSYADSVLPISPNMIWEITFYENTPNQFDLHVISNAAYRQEYSAADLEAYGINFNGGISPFRDAPVDSDLTDAINQGIVFVCSSGDNRTKVDITTGLDYNNYAVLQGLPIYYHRGSTPSTGHPDIVCVGSLDTFSVEPKTAVSNTGPRVDVYAPGENILSAVYDRVGNFTTPTVGSSSFAITAGSAGAAGALATPGVVQITEAAHGLINGDVITLEDCSQSEYNVANATVTVQDVNNFSYSITDNAYSSASDTITGTIKVGYMYQKWDGTSMACAQVTGLLALALEQYPWMNQKAAKDYITGVAKPGLMLDSGGSYTDETSLQGGNNLIAYHRPERPNDGLTLPKTRQWVRPTTGLTYPRQRIKR